MSTSAAEQAETEAAAWHARLSRPAVTTDALREFKAWKADPANAAAYRHVEETWARAGALAHDPEIRRLTQATLAARPPRPGRRPWPAAGLALAVLAVVIGLGGWMLLQASGTRYSTGVGEQRLIVLEDGSRMRLNTDSVVRVRFTRGERRVTLARGEAFFEVAHNPARPFIVAADDAQVRALGTKFDVRREPQAVQVTLLEGRVRVDHDARPAATLDPDQTLTVSPQGVSRPRTVDAAAAANWTTGRLTFRGLPLAAAVAEVNRYTSHKIVLEGPPALAQQPVSGVFDVGDPQAFAAAAASLLDLAAKPQPDGAIRLTPRPVLAPAPAPSIAPPAAPLPAQPGARPAVAARG